MSSLAHCFEKFGIHPLERAEIRKAAKEYRNEGFVAQEANEKALSDYIKSIEENHKGMVDQIRVELTKRGVFEEVRPEEITPAGPLAGQEVSKEALPVSEEGAKQPWETTFTEWQKQPPLSGEGPYWAAFHRSINAKSTFKEAQGAAVRQALSEGKPVPPEVLADYPDLQSPATLAIPPTAQHLELMPEEYPDIKSVAVKQDGKIYTDHVHGEIIVKNNLDPEKAIPGFVTKAGKFVEQYPEAEVTPPIESVVAPTEVGGVLETPVPSKEVTPPEPVFGTGPETETIPKTKKTEQDILAWVRSKGGIDPNTVSADIKSLTQKESGFKGKSAIVRKGGRGLDELAQEWEWETGRPITTDELSDAIKDTVESKKKGIPRKMGLGATDEDIAKFIEKEERKHYQSSLVAADEEFKDYKSFENLTNSFDDEIISFRKEAIRNGLSEADTERSIEQTRKRIENEKVPSTPEGIRTILSKELSSVLPERTPEVTKPELSATAKDQFALPGIKQGLEMKGAKEGATPTLEGTPLGEAARKAEVEKVQPTLGLTEREPESPAPQKTKVKQPYELTADEYLASKGVVIGQGEPFRVSALTKQHGQSIKEALSSGGLSPEDYNRLHAKDYGPIEEFAPEMQSSAKGKEVVASEVASPNLQITAKLRASAESLTKQIHEKRNPAVAQQNVTARRANQTASAYEEADRLENLQNKLNALADAHEGGTVPEFLQGITTRTQVESILRYSKYPGAYLHRSWIEDILNATKGKPGTAKDREILSRVMGRDENGGSLHGDEEITAVENLIKIAEKAGKKSPWAKENIAEHKRMLAAGIDTEEKFIQAKNDLNGLGKKPIDRSNEQKIRTAEQNLLGRKIPGYFPTPKATAERLVEEANIQPGMTVLEPSAGKGNIADVIREKAPDADLKTIEWQGELADILRLKGHEVIGSDFLEHQGKYDRIVMNPPFEKFQDIDHVRHAYEHLNPGGRLVSIMSESPFFRSDKKAVEFREWLDSVGGTIEKLPQKSFSQKSERATGVNSRVVIIDKPEVKAKRVSPAYAAIPVAIPFLVNNGENKRKGVKDQGREYPHPSYLPPGLGR